METFVASVFSFFYLVVVTTIGKTRTLTQTHRPFDAAEPLPGLLVAAAPDQSVSVDRCLIKSPFTVGRSADCSLSVREEKLSKAHFTIKRCADGYVIEDLGSTNGTFLNGEALSLRQILGNADVIRAGQSVFVFHSDVRSILECRTGEQLGIVGRFHADSLVESLKEATLSSRHLLLSGPSGSGKELCAKAIASLLGDGTPLKLLAHNAARFSSEEEAASTLFGVGAKVFSNVDKRRGLIMSANDGVLFLDEIHNLPVRVQRSLLRVIEDGEVTPIGENSSMPCDVRFVFASNASGPDYGLAPDLLARLRRVSVPPLSTRVADIPSLFDYLLETTLAKHRLPASGVSAQLKGDHYEALCLDRFETDNIRGLIDLCDRIATGMALGREPNRVISSVFKDRFSTGPVAARYRAVPQPKQPVSKQKDENQSHSHYEANKGLIIAAFKECGGNISATERLLRARGFRCNRRWIGVFLRKWGTGR